MPAPGLCENEAANFGLSVPSLKGITVPGSSQGTAYPESESTNDAGNSRKPRLNGEDAHTSKACRFRGVSSAATTKPRERVLFSDAARVAERVEAYAAPLGLRGARKWTLAAVITLLCRRWSRVTDDRMRLAQIVEEITCQGGRSYDPQTISRALCSLTEDRLITYRSARGRGRFAEIAIHGQFITDIELLERDESGQVIAENVTFSERVPSTSRKEYLTTLHHPQARSPRRTTRPTEVDVRSGDLRRVLEALPEPLAALPRHLRWMLGREIKNRLARGFLPAQVIAILSAPVPVDLGRPFKLAMYRLRQNMPGVGPRLRPLQQAWDRREATRQREAAQATNARWYHEVLAVTSPRTRAQVLAAHEAKFGRRVSDPVAALAGAGRRVSREHPEDGLAEALDRWSTQILAAATPAATTRGEVVPAMTDLGTELAIEAAPGCIVDGCTSPHASVRVELPLQSLVCDTCWPAIEAQLHADDELGEVC